MKASLIADLAVGVGALAMAGTALVLSASLPTLAADPAGLALWPRILSGVTLVAGATILAGHARRWRRQGARRDPGADSGDGIVSRSMGRVAACAGLCVVYAWLVGTLGFSLPSFLFVAALMWFFGARLVETLVYSVLLAGGLHVFFFHVLGATPPGRDWLVATLRAWF